MKANWTIFLLLFLLCGCFSGGDDFISLTSTSPDRKYSVSIVELDVFIDRNFEIRITDTATGNTRTLFKSPDEGRPVGTERIVWSLDSTRFFLMGRQFFVKEGTADINGQDLYLMFDTETNRLWCNARQQTKYPAFAISDILKKKWPVGSEPLKVQLSIADYPMSLSYLEIFPCGVAFMPVRMNHSKLRLNP